MRKLLHFVVVAASLGSVAGCTSDPNNPAIQAMNNPPNACGPGGTRDIEACSYR